MKPFRAPHEAIGALDAVSAATLAAGASDLALVLDSDGVIRDAAAQAGDLAGEIAGFADWPGRAWSDVFAAEVRPKAARILAEAGRERMSAWRQLTHRAVNGAEMAILYAALRVGEGGRIVVLGRDMRAVSALQQRLIDAQVAMERDYARLRSAETRYRLLFHASSEPVLVLAAGTVKIMELNPAAEALLGSGTRRLIGRPFTDLVAADGRSRLLQHFAKLREARGGEAPGEAAGEIAVTLVGPGAIRLLATPLRQDASGPLSAGPLAPGLLASGLLLVRLHKPVPPPASHDASGPDDGSRLADFVRASSDAFLLVDGEGDVLNANPAFAAMAEVDDVEALRGQSLRQWFGRPNVDFELAMMNLRQHGHLRLFATELRGAAGGRIEVEASAVALGDTFGFTIRDIGRRIEAPARALSELPHSPEQLTELIGRVPLKELVRETTDVIEKLCIEAALDLTNDNRASAAEVLGLSRQSLYVKLRRFGLAEAGGEAEP